MAIIGIFLGSLSLIIVFNITGSVKKKANQEIGRFGDDLITIIPGQVIRAGRENIFNVANTLTLYDVEELKSAVSDIIDIAPFIYRTAVIGFKGNYVNTNILATTDNYFTMKRLELSSGLFFDSRDLKKMSKVCVIGSEIKEKFLTADKKLNAFDEHNIDEIFINQYLNLDDSTFKIVGILEEKGFDFSGADLDDVIIMPLYTYMKRLYNLDYIDGMDLKIKISTTYDQLKESIRNFLRKRHNLKDIDEDDFTILSPVESRNLKDQTIRLVDTLGKITAIISFFIGGLGIFSIMLLIIGFRKVEVGIKRAVGAKRRDIFIQFILESTIITLVGAFFGILTGNIIIFFIYIFAKLPYFFSLKGLILTALSCLLIGIFSGTYPAYIASKLKVVDVMKQ